MEQHDTGRIVPPQKTGYKAVVMMDVRIMVEVDETDDRNDMVRQAKEQLRKRILTGKGFHPFRSRGDEIFFDVGVEDLRYRTGVNDRNTW